MRASIHFPNRKFSRFLVIQEKWSWFRLTSSNSFSIPLGKGDFQYGYLSKKDCTRLPSGWFFAHPVQVWVKGGEDQGMAGADNFGEQHQQLFRWPTHQHWRSDWNTIWWIGGCRY